MDKKILEILRFLLCQKWRGLYYRRRKTLDLDDYDEINAEIKRVDEYLDYLNHLGLVMQEKEGRDDGLPLKAECPKCRTWSRKGDVYITEEKMEVSFWCWTCKEWKTLEFLLKGKEVKDESTNE
jgi:hypothetical protein